jgi:hypothetical protein
MACSVAVTPDCCRYADATARLRSVPPNASGASLGPILKFDRGRKQHSSQRQLQPFF